MNKEGWLQVSVRVAAANAMESRIHKRRYRATCSRKTRHAQDNLNGKNRRVVLHTDEGRNESREIVCEPVVFPRLVISKFRHARAKRRAGLKHTQLRTSDKSRLGRRGPCIMDLKVQA